ncbi:MaoC family dehydratase [Bacillus sp. B15-48]|uniref:MaoC family dehydratase n=1 Tax=Bacillus sp. B15-48 TaxID=1548601 RepID=UPI00193F4FB6|nr:MaoC family dehydratase [Bacillus sp. B15-48]MBM4763503.1 MaoC family dehydratase [Bacillus sp. B15-48]
MSRGKYYDELSVGDVYEHPITRTVTETDNLFITTLTHNPQPLHLDKEFSKESVHGSIIVNSFFTLAFVVGVSVSELTLGTTLGNLGFEKVTFPAPVRIGDTLKGVTEVVDKRESKSNQNRGIVWFEHRGYNQKGELVVQAKRAALMLKSPE